MTSQLVRIGTRGSDLALWQARHVASLLGVRGRAETEIVIVHTSGDRDHSRVLHELPGSGFFTKELQRALLDDEVDIVVHSLKDLPIEEPPGLTVVAVSQRADARDVLIADPEAIAATPLGLRPHARLGTSSLRRAAQSLALQPDLTIAPLRGNVPTRVARLREGRFDGILLAKAGLDRLSLDLTDLAVVPLSLDRFLPSPGQGALAIEARADDQATQGVVESLHDVAAADATTCERMVLKGMGGGCHLPLGAFAERETGGLMTVRVAWGEIDDAVSRASVVHAEGRGSDPRAAAAEALQNLEQLRGGAV